MANAVTTIATNNSIPYEIFWKPLLTDPKINSLPFNLHTGKIGKEIYFDAEFTADPTIKSTCGWDYKTGTAITSKALDPAEYDFSFEQCYTPFVKSIFGDSLPDGWRKGELTPEIIDRIVTKQVNAFNTKLLMYLFFSDTGSSNPDLAGFDGVFAKLLAGAAAVDGTVDAGAVLASDLTVANIEETLYNIYNQQPNLMKSFDNSTKVWIVTQTVYEAWARYLQIGTATGGNLIDRASVQNGVTGITYQGIPMINASWIDRGIALYDSTASASALNPNRIILTKPDNHNIILDGSGFEAIDPFYDRKEDMVYSPASAMLDYQYGYGEFNVFAGF